MILDTENRPPISDRARMVPIFGEQNWLGPGVLATLLYVLVAYWGITFTPDAYGVPLVWPATGVGLAFVTLYGLRLLPAVVLGSLVNALWLSSEMMPLVQTLAGVPVTAIGVGLGAWILRRLRLDPGLRRVRDIFWLLLVGGAVSSSLNAAAGAFAWTAGSSALTFSNLWWVCWTADLMGMLLVAPVMLTLLASGSSSAIRHELPLGLALGAALLGISGAAYLLPLPVDLALPLSLAVFPVIMLTALWASVRLVALHLLLAGAFALTATGAGTGPFADAGLDYHLLALNAQIAILVLTGLLLASVQNERREAESTAHRRLEQLARASRVQTLGQMSAVIAHEINQPLCAVSSYAQTSRRLLARGQHQRLDTALERIDTNTQRASDIVRNIREWSARIPERREVVRMDQLLQHVVTLMRREIRRRGVILETEYEANLGEVEVAPTQVEQVVVNLLNNALDALHDQADPHIRLAAWRASDEICVEVADNGSGIPDSEMATLFDPFVSDKEEGMGLGLALSRSLIESHGGRMQARNRKPRGAAFCFTLPARETVEGSVTHDG